jgi:hypothetical protein
MAKDTLEKGLPPYAPFKTLTSFLGSLDSSQPPRHIDRTMMPTLSGAMQSRLMTSLEFLGFINAEGEVTVKLRDYLKVRSQEAQRKVALKKIIKNSYAGILGDLELASCSPKKLQDAFRATGCEGTTLTDAIRFYIKACQDAGLLVSSFVLARQPRKARRKNGSQSTSEEKLSEVKNTQPQPEPESVLRDMVPIPLFPPPRRVLIPHDITEAECEAVSTMVRAYAKSASQRRMEKSEAEAGERATNPSETGQS